MASLLTIGEIMLELSHLGKDIYKKSFGGDAFNFAYYFAKVAGDSHHVDFLTALGVDEISEQCLEFMRNSGVGISQCERVRGRTIGLFTLDNDEHGEKIYGYWRGESAARHLFDRTRDLPDYEWIVFSGITAAITHNRDHLIESVTAAKCRGAELAYDFNYRELLWSAEEAAFFSEKILPAIDLVKISDEELALLFPGQSVKTLSQRYSDAEWILTCQTQKSEAWHNGRSIGRHCFIADDVAQNVVDSSGAGDAFFASYLAMKLKGMPPGERLKIGHEIAAQVVQIRGSIADIII